MKAYALRYSEIGFGNVGYCEFYMLESDAEDRAEYLNEHEEDFSYNVVEIDIKESKYV